MNFERALNILDHLAVQKYSEDISKTIVEVFELITDIDERVFLLNRFYNSDRIHYFYSEDRLLFERLAPLFKGITTGAHFIDFLNDTLGIMAISRFSTPFVLMCRGPFLHAIDRFMSRVEVDRIRILDETGNLVIWDLLRSGIRFRALRMVKFLFEIGQRLPRFNFLAGEPAINLILELETDSNVDFLLEWGGLE